MISRKINEAAQAIYRRIVYPFIRMSIEKRTKSIMKQGAYLNKGSELKGKNYIGQRVYLSNVLVGYGSYINNDSNMSNTQIGMYTSIGADVTTELGSHPVDGKHVALHPAFYSSAGALGYTYVSKDSYDEMKYADDTGRMQVRIGNDVWIGNHVRILEGVTIGDGAVIGTGAVVTKDVEPYAVYAGVPAVKLRDRFTQDKVAKLLDNPWWEKGEEWIEKNAALGLFDDVDELVEIL